MCPVLIEIKEKLWEEKKKRLGKDKNIKPYAAPCANRNQRRNCGKKKKK